MALRLIEIMHKNLSVSIHRYHWSMIQMLNISLSTPGMLFIFISSKYPSTLPTRQKYRISCATYLFYSWKSESTSAVLSVKMNHSIYHHEATRAEQLRTYKRRSSNHKGRKRLKDYKDPYDAGCKYILYFPAKPIIVRETGNSEVTCMGPVHNVRYIRTVRKTLCL